MLLPGLMLMRVPVQIAIAVSMSVQLPIAVAASAVHAAAGHLPLRLGVQTGVMLLAGALAGRLLARKVSTTVLRAA